jgi:hypothetical protein
MVSVKFIASQARSIYQYKSIRPKVLKCFADIFFNRKCLAKRITPNYANIKIPVTSPASRVTLDLMWTNIYYFITLW